MGLYTNIFFRFQHFRLHNAEESRSTNQRSNSDRKKRAQRHFVRVVLLVLDFVVDTIAGTSMFTLFFLGENKEYYSLFYQRVLHCIIVISYGVLIPIVHLLNESRVRNIIVAEGWLLGIRSVFIISKSKWCFQRSRRNRQSNRNNDGFNGILNRVEL